MMKCLYIFVNGTGVWGIVLIALGYTGEGVDAFVGWVVNNRHTVFCVFSAEFCNEGTVA